MLIQKNPTGFDVNRKGKKADKYGHNIFNWLFFHRKSEEDSFPYQTFISHIIGQSENLCVIIAWAYKHLIMSCLAFLAPDCKEDVMIGLSAFSLSSSSGCRRRFSSSASPNTSSLRFRGDLRVLLAGWRLLGVADDVLVNQLLVTLTSCTWYEDVYQRVDTRQGSKYRTVYFSPFRDILFAFYSIKK